MPPPRTVGGRGSARAWLPLGAAALIAVGGAGIICWRGTIFWKMAEVGTTFRDDVEVGSILGMVVLAVTARGGLAGSALGAVVMVESTFGASVVAGTTCGATVTVVLGAMVDVGTTFGELVNTVVGTTLGKLFVIGTALGGGELGKAVCEGAMAAGDFEELAGAESTLVDGAAAVAPAVDNAVIDAVVDAGGIVLATDSVDEGSTLMLAEEATDEMEVLTAPALGVLAATGRMPGSGGKGGSETVEET